LHEAAVRKSPICAAHHARDDSAARGGERWAWQ